VCRRAVRRVLELTEGYPFFLQEYGRRVWGQDDDPTITLDDVEAAQPVVEADLDEEFYENRIGKLNGSERLYVSAVAHLGDGPQQVGAIATLLGRTHHLAITRAGRPHARRGHLLPATRVRRFHRPALREARSPQLSLRQLTPRMLPLYTRL
jgi:hypothetical protein